MLSRCRGQAFGERPRHHLRLGEPDVVFGLTGVLAGEEFLEADHLRPCSSHLGDAGQRLRYVVFP